MASKDTRANWRLDYPVTGSSPMITPWEKYNFTQEPRLYMDAILSTVSEDFQRVGSVLTATENHNWWIVPWMDYTKYGREPLMGLTKERTTMPGDLSPTSTGGHQVWAVGFYNAIGAETIGEIFEDTCDPQYPSSVQFKEGTVSVKFLFTDAPTSQVEYLEGAPEFRAKIDLSEGSGKVTEREERSVRLLQVDIAVKDKRAQPVGWVFGTFAWVGLARGDQLFDNLEPVSLQWGDDPEKYEPEEVSETWINPLLNGILFGWSERPTLGFHGRANGPADDIKSSCLSCHASAKLPNTEMIPWRAEFNMIVDLPDYAKVQKYVDEWFINLPSGDVFNPNEPAVSALDYSLQLSEAAKRMCSACEDGALNSRTPSICIQAGLFTEMHCSASAQVGVMAAEPDRIIRNSTDPKVPPRQ